MQPTLTPPPPFPNDLPAGPGPDPTATFHRLRPRLRGIAYRMLGTLADAEDVVQDAWLRWHGAEHAGIANAEAWLVSVTTRLAIDRLRSAKVEREHYVGFWLPEPVLTDASPPTPERLLEHADQLSMALLRVLERLAPEARAAFLLREVFDADYADVAGILGKSEAACRQLVHRAKAQVQDERPRYAVSAQAHKQVLQDFAAALTGGDFQALKSLLAEDAQLIGDGGGKVPSFGVPLVGDQRIAQLFFAAHLREGPRLRIELVQLNGEWALLRFFGAVLESAQSFQTDGHRITGIHVQRNPDKLARLAAALSN